MVIVYTTFCIYCSFYVSQSIFNHPLKLENYIIIQNKNKAFSRLLTVFYRIYIFLRKLQMNFTTSQFFTDCTAPFLTESNTIQPNVLPIIIQKIFLITAIPDLIDSILTSHLHIVKVFRIF